MEDHVAVPIGEPHVSDANERDASRVIRRLADEVIPALIDRLAASNLGELEVRQDGWRVRLRRPRGDGAAAGGTSATARPDRSPADRPPEATRPAHSRSRPAPNGSIISSPAVGYYQPRDGLAKGASVRGGDLLGHVDVLGVLHDVAAPEDGRIVETLAEPGEAVEYGQPLARLEPQSRS